MACHTVDVRRARELLAPVRRLVGAEDTPVAQRRPAWVTTGRQLGRDEVDSRREQCAFVPGRLGLTSPVSGRANGDSAVSAATAARRRVRPAAAAGPRPAARPRPASRRPRDTGDRSVRRQCAVAGIRPREVSVPVDEVPASGGMQPFGVHVTIIAPAMRTRHPAETALHGRRADAPSAA